MLLFYSTKIQAAPAAEFDPNHQKRPNRYSPTEAAYEYYLTYPCHWVENSIIFPMRKRTIRSHSYCGSKVVDLAPRTPDTPAEKDIVGSWCIGGLNSLGELSRDSDPLNLTFFTSFCWCGFIPSVAGQSRLEIRASLEKLYELHKISQPHGV